MIAINKKENFLTLDEYRAIAVKTICHFFKSQMRLAYDNDAIDFIIERIMIGDWKFKPEKQCSRESYRCNCAKWAILAYINAQNRQCQKDVSIQDYIKSLDRSNHKRKTEIDDVLLDITDTQCLSEKERSCLLGIYLENDSVADIAQKLEISKGYVKCIRKKAIGKLQRKFGV